MPRDFSDLAAKVTPAVVNVAVTMKAGSDEDAMQMSDRSTQEQMQEFMQEFAKRFGEQGQRHMRPQPKAQAVGTGFIVDPSGIVVTNNHVVGKSSKVEVVLQDNSKYPARVLGRDQRTDIAVLKIKL